MYPTFWQEVLLEDDTHLFRDRTTYPNYELSNSVG